MNAFRIVLVVIFLAISVCTVVVINNHGIGQFNLDFMCFLALSALWVSWCHQTFHTSCVRAATFLPDGR